MSFPLKVQVKQGRLVLNEPIELPEGAVVTLDIIDCEDQLEDSERLARQAAIDEGLLEADRGETVPVEDLFAA